MPKKSKKEKKGLFNNGLVRLLTVAVVAGCVAIIYTTERDCSVKEREIASVQDKIDAYEVENADLQQVLEGDDLSVYIERVAMEERGYAYPDERRFYDASRASKD